MKYAILIYGSDDEWESRSEEERAAIYKEYFALSEESGVFGGAADVAPVPVPDRG